MFDLAQRQFLSDLGELQTGAWAMPGIKELLELSRQCYALAKGTLNPEAKKSLQDIGDQYAQKADDLRHSEITRAVFPNEKR